MWKKNIARRWENIRKEKITTEDYEVLEGQCEDKKMMEGKRRRQEDDLTT